MRHLSAYPVDVTEALTENSSGVPCFTPFRAGPTIECRHAYAIDVAAVKVA